MPMSHMLVRSMHSMLQKLGIHNLTMCLTVQPCDAFVATRVIGESYSVKLVMADPSRVLKQGTKTCLVHGSYQKSLHHMFALPLKQCMSEGISFWCTIILLWKQSARIQTLQCQKPNLCGQKNLFFIMVFVSLLLTPGQKMQFWLLMVTIEYRIIIILLPSSYNCNHPTLR